MLKISILLGLAPIFSMGFTACGESASVGQPHANQYTPYPEVASPREGISWPKGQALPIFAAPAKTLDTIDVQILTRDEQITFSALQGRVNRKKPRIYLVDARSDEGRDTWAETSSMALGARNMFQRDNKYDLVARYAGEVNGVVLYDTRKSPHYRNLAGTVAGITGALPATTEVFDRMKENGIDLDIVEDLRGLEFGSAIEIYEYLYERYWEKCEHRLMISARPDNRGGDFHHTRDIAAACGAAVVWLDNRIPAERDVMRKFFGDMEAGNAIALGWYTTERSGITTATESGIGTLPADHYISGSVYSGIDHQILIPPVPKKPELEKKAYVAIFISDGDNIQYTQRAMRKIWDETAPIRGKVPISWTIAPGLVDIGPGILNYYYSTATENECFVTGPSGMGYAMPFNTLKEPGAPVGVYLEDKQKMDGYARLTETYLQRSGLRVITIWDNATLMQRDSYERNCRNLYGATVQNFRDVPSVEGSVEGSRIRFDKLVIPYVGTYEHISNSLRQKIRDWDGQAPLFLSYQMSVWGEMKPDKIVELQETICREFPGKVQFVRADHYFTLYNEAHDIPFNVCMSPRISSRGSAGHSEGVIDGTPTTFWASEPEGDQWILLDLGEVYRISRYVIRHAGSAGLFRQLNTRGYKLLGSEDGDSWATMDLVKGNMENVTDIELKEPAHARYLKLIIDDPGSDGIARIGEIEIYGIATEKRR